MKIKLTKKDGSEHYVQPDLFVMEAEKRPVVIAEVISDETRSKDMIKKLDLYMKTGIREYWLVDPEAGMVMIYSFSDYDLNGSQVFTIRQSLESKFFLDLKINMSDILRF
jgi:Uma2 family endonuclease